MRRPPRQTAAPLARSLAVAAAAWALAGLASPPPAWGQLPAVEAPAEPPPAEAEAPPPAPKVPPEMATPRACLRAFLKRMSNDEQAEAAQLLDLAHLSPAAAATKGPELAYKLYASMQRLVRLPGGDEWPPVNEDEAFDQVPNDPNYDEAWSLASMERYPDNEAERITIARDDQGRWHFDKETVDGIDQLFVDTGDKEKKSPVAADAKTTKTLAIVIEELFPKQLRTTLFLLPSYQWICLLLIAVAGRLASLVTRTALTAIADTLLHRNDPDFDGTSRPVWRQVGRLVSAATWFVGASVIGLPNFAISLLLNALLVVTIFAGVGAVWAVISLVADYFSRRAKRGGRRFDDLVVPLVATTAKVFAGVVAAISVYMVYKGELPTALLGGLGIGGVAIALASQETLSNFFGSVTVLFDRPFEVGDWVRVENHEGEIESVGFRSTKIRTGINSQVTLPNSTLAGAAIDNWGRRRYRRYLTRLGVEYGTDPERIEAFCEGVRELIRRHPHTRKDFYACYFNEFGASSLEILLVAFFEAPDWVTELRERHRLLCDVARLAKRLDVSFAFPTQTVHLHRGDDAEAPPPPEDPDDAGQRIAAEIAGELPNYQDRPGRVKFSGPTPIEPRP